MPDDIAEKDMTPENIKIHGEGGGGSSENIPTTTEDVGGGTEGPPPTAEDYGVPDEKYVYAHILGGEVDLGEKTMVRFETLVSGQTKEFKTALGDSFGSFKQEVVGIHKKTLRDIKKNREMLLKVSRKSLQEEIEEEGGHDPELKKILSKLNLRIAELTHAQTNYNELMESQTPEALRAPTAARVGGELGSQLEMFNRVGQNLPRETGEDGELVSADEHFVNIASVVYEQEDLDEEAARELIISKTGEVGVRAERLLDRVENSDELDEAEKSEISSNIKEELARFTDTENQYRSKLYHQEVSGWFEDQLRRIETTESSIERNELLPRLSTALSFLRYKEGTRTLARDLEKGFVARLRLQNLTQAWNFNPADAQMESAAQFTLKNQKEIFTHTKRDELADFISEEIEEELESTTPIADEFFRFEDYGSELKVAREEHERAVAAGEDPQSVEEKKKKAEDLEDEIRDYFYHGGETVAYQYDEQGNVLQDEEGNNIVKKIFVDDRIEKLEEKRTEEGNLSPEDEEELKELREKLWARLIAGNIWSTFGRAGEHGVNINGLADLHTGRIMHITREFEGKDVYSRTKGLWGEYTPPPRSPEDNPEPGKLDMGMSDYLEGYLLKEGYDPKRPEKKGFDPDNPPELGSVEFWNNIIKEDKGRGKGVFGPKFINDLGNVHKDVSRLRGSEGFLQNPSNERFQRMKQEKLFQHLSDDFVDGGSRYGGGQATEREEKIAEFLDRILIWTKDPQSWELLEEMEFYGDSERKDWIDQSDKYDGVTTSQRDHFYEEHLNLPGLGMFSPKTRAELRARLHTAFVGIPREFKWHLMTSTAAETLKRWLAFIFSE